jgi:hypothetical protein
MSIEPVSQTVAAARANLPAAPRLLEIVGDPLPDRLLQLIVCHLPEEEAGKASIQALCDKPGFARMEHLEQIYRNLYRYASTLYLGRDDNHGHADTLPRYSYPMSKHGFPLSSADRIKIWENRQKLELFESPDNDDQLEERIKSLTEVQEVLIELCPNLHTLKALSRLPNLRKLDIGGLVPLQNDGVSGSAPKNGKPSFDLAALSLKKLESLTMTRGEQLRTIDLQNCSNLRKFEFRHGLGCKDVVTIDARGLDCEIIVERWPDSRYIIHTTDELGREIVTRIDSVPPEEARRWVGREMPSFHSHRPLAKAAEKAPAQAGSFSLS